MTCVISLNTKETCGRSARNSFKTFSKSSSNKKKKTTQVRPRTPQTLRPYSDCNKTRCMSKKALKALGVGTVELHEHCCWPYVT